MSKSIICGQCHSENSLGSKFCGNCGSQLPQDPETICPSCETANPQDRVYCDNCGTRLVADGLPSESDKLATEEETELGSKPFALPTREPGSTGELDPGSLLEHLTDSPQEREESRANEEQGTGELPRVEELTPEGRSTADLPEWLVSEHDSEPIIGAPDSLTTGQYLDLLSESPDADGGPSDATDDATLPDWLATAALSPDDNQSEEDAESTEDALTGWLSSLGESGIEDGPSDDAGSPVDWLSELGPPNTDLLAVGTDSDFEKLGDDDSGERSLPDWMSELGPPNTDMLSVPSDSGLDSSETTTFASEQLPDWISDLGPPDTKMLSVPTDFDEEPAGQEDDGADDSEPAVAPVVDDRLPDWMSQLEATGSALLSGADDEQRADPEALEQDAGTTNWLVDFDETLADMPYAPQEDQPVQAEDDLTSFEDMVDGEHDLGHIEEEPEAPSPDSEMEGLEEQTGEDEDADSWWLDQFDSETSGPDAQDVFVVQDESLSFEADDLPDATAIAPVESEIEEMFEPDLDPDREETAPPLDLGEIPGDVGADEIDRGTVEALLDRLDEAEPVDDDEMEESAGVPADILPELLDDQELTSSPGWMDMAEGIVHAAEPVLDARDADESTSEQEHLPEWLAEEGLPETALPGGEALESPEDSETIPAFDEADLPDWLTDPGLEDDEVAAESSFSSDAPGSEHLEETEESLPDWLDVSEQVVQVKEESPVKTSEVPSDTFGYFEAEPLPEWLRDDQPPAATDPEEEVTTHGSLESPAASGTGELSDWVHDLQVVDESGTGLLGDADAAADELAESKKVSEESISGWVDELDSVDAQFDSETDWELAAASDLPTFIADEIPGWPSEPNESGESDVAPQMSDADLDATETLANWFAEIDEESTVESEEIDEALDDIFDDEELSRGTELLWMTAPLVLESDEEEAVAEEEPSPEAAEPPASTGETLEVFEAPLDEEPDWLSELESLDAAAFLEDPGETTLDTVPEEVEHPTIQVADEAASEVQVAKEVVAEAEDSSIEDRSSETSAGALESSEEDWMEDGDLLGDVQVPDEVPDWLEQLGLAADQAPESQIPDELLSSQDMPDWVADLKPSTDSEMGSILPTALGRELESEESFADLGDEFGDSDLPDWLMGATPAPVDSGLLETPSPDEAVSSSWFESDKRGDLDDLLSLGDEPINVDDSTLGDLLGDLPLVRPADEELVKAEIPDWIMRLKPRDLSEELSTRAVELPEETKGPLAGMRGVIGIEPIIDVPRLANAVAVFSVTKEQQQQAALLRRLTQWEEKPTQIAVRSPGGTPAWIRIVLAILLLAAVSVGLWAPDMFGERELAPSQETVDASAAISRAAGEPLLFAVDFTPAMAGELMPQVELLLQEIQSHGSPVVFTTQFATGSAFIDRLMQPQAAFDLGIVPGEAIGLRQLGDCIAKSSDCDRLLGRDLEPEVQEMLKEVALVVLVTGDRNSLVNWIEQVAVASDRPLIAGLTQSLGPLASPYLASGQLDGAIVGIPEAEAYQSSLDLLEGESLSLPSTSSALGLAQFLAAAVLLLGAVVHLIARDRPGRDDSTVQGTASTDAGAKGNGRSP